MRRSRVLVRNHELTPDAATAVGHVLGAELRACGVALATLPLIPLSLVLGFEYVNPYFLVIFPVVAFISLGAERRLLRGRIGG